MDEKDKNLSKKEHIRMKLLEQQGEAKLVRKIIMITIASLILLIGIVGLVGFLYINSAMKPVDPDDDTIKKVKIPIGSSVNGISTLLEAGIIKDARVFKYYINSAMNPVFRQGINYHLPCRLKILSQASKQETHEGSGNEDNDS
jgi:UPF0755 protein